MPLRRKRRTGTPEHFLGPWELFEVLGEEFQELHGIAPAAAMPWRVQEPDVLDAPAVTARVGELGFGPPPADATAGQLAALLNAALEREPEALLDACAKYLHTDRGRALEKNAPGNVPAEELLRFNRLVLDEAFSGILLPASERELTKLFERVDRDGGAEARWALCLSGGGIRSASFSLGVIQALGRCRTAAGESLLGRFDYLSTVSGGGYMGSWLSAWMSREGHEEVLLDLSGTVQPGPLDSEPGPVRYLRSYTNFLSPRKGAASPDMWTLWATVLRNLLLTWFVLLPVVAVVLFVPMALAAAAADPPNDALVRRVIEAVLLALSFGGLVTGVWFVHSRRPDREPEGDAANADHKHVAARDRDQRAFLIYCLLPLCLGATALFLLWMWRASPGTELRHAFWPLSERGLWSIVLPGAAVVHLAGWIAALVTTRARWRTGEAATVALSGFAAGSLGLLSAWVVHSATVDIAGWLIRVHPDRLDRLVVVTDPTRPRIATAADIIALGYTVLAVPTILLAITLGGFLFVGLSSRRQYDEEREWSARYSAWLLIVVAGWVLVGFIVLGSGPILDSVPGLLLGASAGGAGWAGAALGKSAKTAAKGPTTSSPGLKASVIGMVQQHALSIIAPLAVMLVLVTLATANATLVERLPTDWPALARVLAVAVVIGLLGMFTSYFVDVNKFSLHAMYRARLIRAYLGASRPPGSRHPDPFTGFDPGDNLSMESLRRPAAATPGRRPAPIHLLNLSLNLVAGRNLAWQDRKARSFAVTPFFAGSFGVGYRRTRLTPGLPEEAYFAGEKGISLGTALAISGAAASPNMGYYSSPAVTFLMTLFNARLGWWLGNPGWAGGKRIQRTGGEWYDPGPIFHSSNPPTLIPPIFRELVGFTTDSESLVYLSDGGHFENLGLYEMVLRRCRLVVIVDASCDEKCNYPDLGNAVRKVRVDLGVPINFGPFEILPRGADGAFPNDGSRLAVGTIDYQAVDPRAANGVVIYLKPVMTGVEPRDVYAYARGSSPFPHESTVDQFFSEMQFESYRALGDFSGTDLADAIRLATAQAPATVQGTVL